MTLKDLFFGLRFKFDWRQGMKVEGLEPYCKAMKKEPGIEDMRSSTGNPGKREV